MAEPRRVHRELLLAFRERAVILLDQLAELLRHFVAAGHERAIRLVADLAPQPEFEPLQPFGDLLLQLQQLTGIAIVASVLELAEALENLVELLRIDVLFTQHVAQRTAFADPAARFVAELTDVFGAVPIAG